MKVTVNGSKISVADTSALSEIIKKWAPDKSKFIVLVSGEIISPDKFRSKKLKEGEEIEIISFVGGG